MKTSRLALWLLNLVAVNTLVFQLYHLLQLSFSSPKTIQELEDCQLNSHRQVKQLQEKLQQQQSQQGAFLRKPPPIVTPPQIKDNNNQGKKKNLLYITTHMSQEHIWYLKACWPLALKHSKLLRESDVAVYLNSPPSAHAKDIALLQQTFLHQNLTVHIADNPGWQAGAMAALSDAMKARWWDPYQWVIRVNPDVIIRDESFLVYTMEHDPTATALLINCHTFTGGPPTYKAHTDFFMIQPSALPRTAFSNQTKPSAETSFTIDIQESIIDKGHARWIPNTYPLSNDCRAGGDRPTLQESPISHFHPLQHPPSSPSDEDDENSEDDVITQRIHKQKVELHRQGTLRQIQNLQCHFLFENSY